MFKKLELFPSDRQPERLLINVLSLSVCLSLSLSPPRLNLRLMLNEVMIYQYVEFQLTGNA